MPLLPVLTIGVVPLAVNCVSVIVAPPLIVSEVREADGPSVNVPVAVSPVPAGLLPLAKSLSFTCASVPATVPLLLPLMVTTSSTGVTLKLSTFGVWSVFDGVLVAPPPLSCTWKLIAPSVATPMVLTLAAGVKVSLPALISATLITWLAAIAIPFNL